MHTPEPAVPANHVPLCFGGAHRLTGLLFCLCRVGGEQVDRVRAVAQKWDDALGSMGHGYEPYGFGS